MYASKRAVLVLGAHRSGTSMVARMLCQLGASEPVDVMPPRDDNPGGFCEPLSVVRLNNRILAELDLAWDDPRVLGLGGEAAHAYDLVNSWVYAQYRNEMADALRRSFPEAVLICLKDPRVCLFPAAWHRVLRESGYSVSTVFVHRQPLAVAQSLAQRNGTPLPKGLRLWCKYILAGLRYIPDDALVVQFESLADDPKAAVSTFLERLSGLDAERRSTAEEVVDADAIHQQVTEEGWDESPLATALLEKVRMLLSAWELTRPAERRAALEAVEREYREASTLFGQIAALPHKPRRVVLHYHLFKNAGTSVDEVLRRNFGARWFGEEFLRSGGRTNVDLVEAWLETHPEAEVLSSHTALGPLPRLRGLEVLPIIFLRHPIVRIASAYRFERQQKTETDGSKLAQSTDFAGYVTARLDNEADRACRSFQTKRLAGFAPARTEGTELERAIAAYHALPFVGIVEQFAASMARLGELIRRWYPQFEVVEVHKNVTETKTLTVEERVAAARGELGEACFDRLMQANADDLALHQYVLEQAGEGPPTSGQKKPLGEL